MTNLCILQDTRVRAKFASRSANGRDVISASATGLASAALRSTLHGSHEGILHSWRAKRDSAGEVRIYRSREGVLYSAGIARRSKAGRCKRAGTVAVRDLP